MASTYPLLQLFFLDTEEEVKAIRDRAKAIILEGKTLMEVESGGKSGRKQFAMPPDRVMLECNAALKHLNPLVYGRRRRRVVSIVTCRS